MRLLKILEKAFIFHDADADWLHCVVGHRKANTFPAVVEEMKKYDVIEEQKKFAVDAMVTLVVEELVNDLKLNPTYIAEPYKKEMDLGGDGNGAGSA